MISVRACGAHRVGPGWLQRMREWACTLLRTKRTTNLLAMPRGCKSQRNAPPNTITAPVITITGAGEVAEKQRSANTQQTTKQTHLAVCGCSCVVGKQHERNAGCGRTPQKAQRNFLLKILGVKFIFFLLPQQSKRTTMLCDEE